MRYLIFIIILSQLCACATSENYVQRVDASTLNELNGVMYVNDEKAPFSGIAIHFYDEMQLKSMTRYKNGILHGVLETYYSDGQLEIREEYSRGKKNGLQEVFYEGGELFTRFMFKNGLFVDTHYIMYFADGKIRAQGPLKNGVRHGSFKRFKPDGGISLEQCYDNGKVIHTGGTDPCLTEL